MLYDNYVFQMRREVRGPYDFNTNTRFVEMYIVNDYKTVSIDSVLLAVIFLLTS